MFYFYLFITDPAHIGNLEDSLAFVRWPQLRVVVRPGDYAHTLQSHPELARWLVDATRVPHIDAVFQPNQAAEIQDANGVIMVTLAGLEQRYEAWRRTTLRHLRARLSWRTPDELLDVDGLAPLHLEVIGACQAHFLVEYTSQVAPYLLGPLEAHHVVKNSVAPVDPAPWPWDVALVIPPLRAMTGGYLDAELHITSRGDLLAKLRDTLQAYLDSTRLEWPERPLFVATFLPPALEPDGLFPGSTNLGDIVSAANEIIASWVGGHDNCWVMDYARIAETIGLAATEDSSVGLFAHRTMLDRTDDWLDARVVTDPMSLDAHIDIAHANFAIAVLREVQAMEIALKGDQQIKVVVTDLDNTLWRGEATRDDIQHRWHSRFGAYAEALWLLKRRGLQLAIISRNDPEFIRTHWDNIIHDGSTEPLRIPLALDDFDAVEISFEPKWIAMQRILDQFGVLPVSVVFIDDDPYERERMRRAFPNIKLLGAEPFLIRRELLHSPATQRPFVNELADARRHSASVRRSLINTENNNSTTFLQNLGLTATVEIHSGTRLGPESRVVQLINKTNQWSLNGQRCTSVAPSAVVISVILRDNVADHGCVAVAVVEPAQAVVLHMAVSCRVLGMGADLVLAYVVRSVLGVRTFLFAPTERNHAAQRFFERYGDSLDAGTLAPPDFVDVKLEGDEQALSGYDGEHSSSVVPAGSPRW